MKDALTQTGLCLLYFSPLFSFLLFFFIQEKIDDSRSSKTRRYLGCLSIVVITFFLISAAACFIAFAMESMSWD